MHLMSFYATPYASRHREQQAAKKRFALNAGLFLAGCFFTGLLFYAFSPSSDEVSPSTPFQEALESEAINIEDALKPDEHAADTTDPLLSKLKSDGQEAEVIEEVKIAEPVWPKTIEISVSSGDTFNSLMIQQGIASTIAHRLAQQIKPHYNVGKLQLNDVMTVTLSKDDARMAEQTATNIQPTTLEKLIIKIDEISHIEVTPTGADSFAVKRVKKKLVRKEARAKTRIEGSLYMSAQQQGMPSSAINKLIKNYSYDVDFQRDIKAGDALDVIYEVQKTEDGSVVNNEDANIVYSMLKNKGRVIKQYRFKDEHGYENYYNEKGQNIVKKLLKTPVNGARMSSNFGMRRHPILGYTRMHTGIDFAVPQGTPIYAAGDGVVSYAGYKGGYGKYVSIKHNTTYTTAYAHAHRIANGIRSGARVRQGQVIAYVGSTGRSTGPHLHYEILRYGKHVNPANVKFTGGNELTGRQLAAFKQHIKNIEQKLITMKSPPDKLSALASNQYNF
jgi:murein DD-endopeptidase MepM/ murein hydrolase activator NlpD